MKMNYPFMSLLLSAALTVGCSTENDDVQIQSDSQILPPTSTAGFAEDDGAKPLGNSAAQKLFNILRKTGPDIAKGYGEINITPEEAEEIKVFTDSLVQECKSDEEKYKKIFAWLYKTLDYKHEYEGGDFINNDPYPVFKTHVAICQGFSNLQHIMLESQNIPTLNVNGEYLHVGGHAWNYVYFDNKWTVSDATNNGSFGIMAYGTYKHLIPHSMDATFFETENCSFNYQDQALNVNEIKGNASQFIVPYSAEGYKVTSLNPTKPVPASVKEIYIGKNIETLGVYYRGLEKNAPSIEAAYVDPKNRKLVGYTGAVYRKNGVLLELYYLPASLKMFELKPMKYVDKNVVFDHPSLEEVIIPAGTEEIRDYAFEKCPKLKVAYVPEGVKISEKAFWNVHPDFKVVRKDLTGIPEIRI